MGPRSTSPRRGLRPDHSAAKSRPFLLHQCLRSNQAADDGIHLPHQLDTTQAECHRRRPVDVHSLAGVATTPGRPGQGLVRARQSPACAGVNQYRPTPCASGAAEGAGRWQGILDAIREDLSGHHGPNWGAPAAPYGRPVREALRHRAAAMRTSRGLALASWCGSRVTGWDRQRVCNGQSHLRLGLGRTRQRGGAPLVCESTHIEKRPPARWLGGSSARGCSMLFPSVYASEPGAPCPWSAPSGAVAGKEKLP